MKRLFGALVLVAAIAWPVAGSAQQSCADFGAGFTQHPDFPQACCHPGFVPYPGVMKCVRPDQLPGAGGGGDGGGSGGEAGGGGGAPTTGAPGGHCIPLGGTCTLHGAPCCDAGATCQGKFPNTICQ